MQSVTINDFSGGLIDNVIGGSPRHAAIYDNIVPLTHNRSARSRTGSNAVVGMNQVFAGISPIEPASLQSEGGIDLIDVHKQKDYLLIFYANKLYTYKNQSNKYRVDHVRGGTPDITSSHNLASTSWANHTLVVDGEKAPAKIYYDDIKQKMVWREAGMPRVFAKSQYNTGEILKQNAISIEVEGAIGREECHYIYYFVLNTRYTTVGKTFEDFGPVAIYTATQCPANPSQNPIHVSGIPLVADIMRLWNIPENTVIKIYRSTKGGTVPYYLGELTDETEFTDSVDDSELIRVPDAKLYIAGGVKQNFPPPTAKYVHIYRNTAFYAGITSTLAQADGRIDAQEEDPYIIYQSKIGDPDSVPKVFFEKFDDEITGLSSTGEELLVFCKKKIYNVRGFISDRGGGEYSISEISESAGCLSHNGIVQVEKSVFWLGRGGIYTSNGTSVTKIPSSQNIVSSYSKWIENMGEDIQHIQGAYDDKDNKIMWTLRDEENRHFILVTDLNFSEEGGAIIRWIGGPNTQHFEPKSLLFHNDILYRGDYGVGLLLEHRAGILGDYDYVTDGRKPVWFHYRSCALNLGTDSASKWVSKMMIVALNERFLSLNVDAYNNLSNTPRHINKILGSESIDFDEEQRDTMMWYDELNRMVWGDPKLIQKLLFLPRDDLRTNYIQIDLQPASVPIFQVTDPVGGSIEDAGEARFIDPEHPNHYSKKAKYTIFFEKVHDISRSGVQTVRAIYPVPQEYFKGNYLEFVHPDNQDIFKMLITRINNVTDASGRVGYEIFFNVNLSFNPLGWTPNVTPTISRPLKLVGYQYDVVLNINSYSLFFEIVGPSFDGNVELGGTDG